jgi:4-amino-4-deoxy-L-arabinose transferase-like glycosyltransferase
MRTPVTAAVTLGQPEIVSRHWPDAIVVALLITTISLIYGARLSLQPLVGEETRWATGAREMLATGDWIVPRQQGKAFPERPPMTMWAMAAAGWLRGEIDPIAVRLPSVIAVVLTSLLTYSYARVLISQTVAIAAALIYATFGQVLQIGRLGESEAAFALFVSASLLTWHLGYVRNWRPVLVWSAGFALAALAALVKGPQAPVYFGAITGAYLLFMRRDWQYLLSWQTAAGGLVFVAVVAAWQIPFYRATDWSAVVATWAGLAGDRFKFSGVLSHAVTYPAETFVCLLPWSPMLFALIRANRRELLADKWQVVSFLLTAMAIAYPTVWMAAGARGRYFMPLYPVAAILVGMLIERCSAAKLGTSQRRGWNQFVLLWSFIFALAALGLGCIVFLPGDLLQSLYQPRSFCVLLAVVAAGAPAALWANYRRQVILRPLSAVFTIALAAALVVSGIKVNVNAGRWYDATAGAEEFKSLLPAATELVSLTAIDHRFAYYYGSQIDELVWPRAVSDIPPNVDYFCFMRLPGDSAASRQAGRGRTWQSTPGTLPFAWKEVAAASFDRQKDSKLATVVVLGRVVRPLRAEVTDATVPQQSLAKRQDGSQRK